MRRLKIARLNSQFCIAGTCRKEVGSFSESGTIEIVGLCLLCSFEGKGHHIRKHLISMNDYIIKEDDLRLAVGRGARLDLTLTNLKHVQAEERRLVYKQIYKKKSSSKRRWVASCAAARDDTAAEEAGIGQDSVTVVSVAAETSSNDSANEVSSAGELPTQISELLEKFSKRLVNTRRIGRGSICTRLSGRK